MAAHFVNNYVRTAEHQAKIIASRRNRALVTAICPVCLNSFAKLRCLKAKFCSRACSNEATARRNKSSPRRTVLTPFGWFNKAKSRCKRSRTKWKLTKKQLKAVWDRQQGICPFTGWQLILPKNGNGFACRSLLNASLDRLDNNRDYTSDNVRFTTIEVNLGKHHFADDEFARFCQAVARRYEATRKILGLG